MKTLLAISLNTFKETIRDRLLFSLIGFAVLVIAASLLAGSISLGQDVRVIKSFGLTAMLIFLLIITIFIGTQLVFREVERKTIYFALTKPISREVFYLGKFFGLCLTILVSAAIMTVIFSALLLFKQQGISSAVIWAAVFLVLEAWLLTALGLLFSSFTSPLSSAIYTFCLVLIGHSAATIWFIAQKAPAAINYLLQFIYYTFPNLEKFNLRNEVVFNLSPDPIQAISTIGYFLGYTALLLLIGTRIFRRDEF